MNLCGRVVQRFLEAGGYRTLYHIGKRPAEPKPKSISIRKDRDSNEDEWVRNWLDRPVKEVAFLTPKPLSVYIDQGIRGNLYAYRVPEWVIQKAGGIHRFDWASEVLIPKPLWKYVKFLGKKMDAKALDTWIQFKQRPQRYFQHGMDESKAIDAWIKSNQG
jgi:hypothetical protein